MIWDFVRKLKTNLHALEILGYVKQKKEFIHVSDCVGAMLIGYERSSSKVNTFNVATDGTKPVDQVADIVVDVLGLKNTEVKRVYTGGEREWIGDNPVAVLDASRIKGLGWSPRVSADEAISRTARWAKKVLG